MLELKTWLIEQLKKQGFAFTIVILGGFYSWQRSEDSYKRTIEENMELRVEVSKLRDKFNDYLIKESQENRELMRDIREYLKNERYEIKPGS